MKSRLAVVGACALSLSLASVAVASDDDEKEPSPGFSQEYIDDAVNQNAGKELWQDQCAHCHGAKAYPGKAPKLKPRRYNADFVWDRVSNGFRKMPAWKEVYTKEERMQIVAFIMGKTFSP